MPFIAYNIKLFKSCIKSRIIDEIKGGDTQLKKLCIAFALLIILGYTQEAKLTQVYFDENLTNLQCVKIFVNLVRSSDFDFKAWRGDKSVEWVKEAFHLNLILGISIQSLRDCSLIGKT